jgi:hypothetical protein
MYQAKPPVPPLQHGGAFDFLQLLHQGFIRDKDDVAVRHSNVATAPALSPQLHRLARGSWVVDQPLLGPGLGVLGAVGTPAKPSCI